MTAAMSGQVLTGRYQGAAGTRAWRLYVPSTYNRARPPMLLVLLHGCTQTADDIARGSQMDVVAEEQGFLVLYPEQSTEANPRTCWNWFDAANQRRDAGEPSIIAGMVADVMTHYPADPARVHIAGVSAGAAMAGLTAVAYPERFATLSSASGIAWGAAQNVGRALSVMAKGAGDGVPGRDSIIAAMGTHARAIPTLVIHGGADAVVSPHNGEETAAQWVSVFERLRSERGEAPLVASAPATANENGYTVQHTAWHDTKGTAMVEYVRVNEMGHAWAGGSTAGTFADAKGPNASRLIAAFCARHSLAAR